MAWASPRLDGRKQVEQGFRKVFDATRSQATGPPYLHIVPRDLRIQQYGEVAIASFEFQRDGDSFGRRTIVFRHRPMDGRSCISTLRMSPKSIDMDSQLVESYKFSDIVALWARERLVHEVLVARELAQGFVAQSLRLHSANPKWIKATEPFSGDPYVGYAALPGETPVCIRASALEHLLAVARGAADHGPRRLSEEFVTKSDFRQWLVRSGRSYPAFWFDNEERGHEARHATPS